MGFTSKIFDFLSENHHRNNKIWFEEHKSEFQQFVITPLSELVEDLAPTMLSIDQNLICEPKVGKSISRIYRDIRFSKDKSLYRDLMWIVFLRNKKQYPGFPGFFFELSPVGFRYGCGYYQAENDSMEAIRCRILENDESFQYAFAAYQKQTVFTMEGDIYKKSRHPDQPENLQNWLDRKSICFIHNSTDFDLLFSDSFAEKLSDDYQLLIPIYRFLLETEMKSIEPYNESKIIKY